MVEARRHLIQELYTPRHPHLYIFTEVLTLPALTNTSLFLPLATLLSSFTLASLGVTLPHTAVTRNAHSHTPHTLANAHSDIN